MTENIKSNNAKRIVIFARVSSTSDRQDYQRQITDLTEFANTRGYHIEKIFAEKISGGKKNKDRKELMSMIDYINGDNNIDMVCVTEISRLGRNTLEVLKTIEILNENKISLYIQNYNMETLNEEKKVNPMVSFMVTVMAEVANIERSTIANRLSSGYHSFRKSGGQVGRKKGYRKSKEEIMEQYAEEIKLIQKGYSYLHISKLTNTNKNTLVKIKKMLAA